MPILQLKVTMNNSSPKCSRTILIHSKSTFDDLHEFLQICFNFENYHLWRFELDFRFNPKGIMKDNLIVQKYLKNAPLEDSFIIEKTNSEWESYSCVEPNNILIDEIFVNPKDWINYNYDFGDSWEFRVELQKILEVVDFEKAVAKAFKDMKSDNLNRTELPICTKVAGLCPFEDIGGVWGYGDFVDFVSEKLNSKDENYSYIKESIIERLGIPKRSTIKRILLEWEDISNLEYINQIV